MTTLQHTSFRKSITGLMSFAYDTVIPSDYLQTFNDGYFCLDVPLMGSQKFGNMVFTDLRSKIKGTPKSGHEIYGS